MYAASTGTVHWFGHLVMIDFRVKQEVRPVSLRPTPYT